MFILFAVAAIISGPVYHSRDGLSFKEDPSLRAVTNEFPKVGQGTAWAERYRIRVDLNGDDVDDLILSDPYGFGNGGGPWTAYVHTNDVWTVIGDLGFHPAAFNIEETSEGGVRLWYYWHLSGHDGRLGYYEFKNGRMDNRPSELLIDTGDGGTPLGNALYKAAFKTKSNHDFQLELSSTTNGVVRWGPVKR